MLSPTLFANSLLILFYSDFNGSKVSGSLAFSSICSWPAEEWKFAMKAGIHRWLDKNHLRWSLDIADSLGKDFINAFTEVLWSIDGHERKLAARCRKDIANLFCDILDHHVSTLNHFLLHLWMRSAIWMPV